MCRFVPSGGEPRLGFPIRRRCGHTASRCAANCPSEFPTCRLRISRPFFSLGIHSLSAPFLLGALSCAVPESKALSCAALYCLHRMGLTSTVCLPSALLPQSNTLSDLSMQSFLVGLLPASQSFGWQCCLLPTLDCLFLPLCTSNLVNLFSCGSHSGHLEQC